MPLKQTMRLNQAKPHETCKNALCRRFILERSSKLCAICVTSNLLPKSSLRVTVQQVESWSGKLLLSRAWGENGKTNWCGFTYKTFRKYFSSWPQTLQRTRRHETKLSMKFRAKPLIAYLISLSTRNKIGVWCLTSKNKWSHDESLVIQF